MLAVPRLCELELVVKGLFVDERQDGEGYAFLADIALQLDPKNPQVAARLLSSFKSWRALEPLRRAAAEAQLKRVAAADLSADSRDIVGRALA